MRNPSECGMRNAECGMRNYEGRVWIADGGDGKVGSSTPPQAASSSFRILHSAFRIEEGLAKLANLFLSGGIYVILASCRRIGAAPVRGLHRLTRVVRRFLRQAPHQGSTGASSGAT